MKGYMITALVAAVTVALIFRVPQIKSIIIGG